MRSEVDACIKEAHTRPIRSSIRVAYVEYVFGVTGARALGLALEKERVHAEVVARRERMMRSDGDLGGRAAVTVAQGLRELSGAAEGLRSDLTAVGGLSGAKAAALSLLRDRGRVIADSFKQFRLGYREVVAAADPAEEQKEAEALATAIREKDVDRITGAVAKAATDIIGEEGRKEIGKAMKVVGESTQRLAERAKESEQQRQQREKT